ncbi:MAG: multidrug effflux MFS transporter [Pikeienuella sp.]
MSDTGARFLDRGTPPALITLVLLISVSVLSMNAFIASLPALARDFETDYSFMQIAVSGYLAMTAAMQIVIGPLADRFGRRPVILLGLVVFIAASIGCIYAPDAETFMALRMVQCSVAVGMVLSRAIVRDMLEGDAAASMIGYMTAAMSLVPMIAPMYGGYMEDLFGWRATFWSFVVFGVLVLALIWFDLGETNRSTGRSFAAQIAEYPGLLKARRFWGYTLTAAFASGSFFALLGGGPFVAREIYGLSPGMTGLSLGVVSLGYLFGNLLSGRYVTRVGMNKMMLAGGLIAAGGMGLGVILVLIGFEHPVAVFGPSIFIGFGNGVTLPSASNGTLSVRPQLAGSASGLGGAMMIGGGAALSAITGALLSQESGAFPLVAMMFGSAVCSVITALYVIRRAKIVGAGEA